MPDLVSNAVAKADTAGTALVVSEIKAYMLSEISERIHQRENRCGGFFAFATREEADAFVPSDRSAQAINSRALLATYTIDNQATVNPWLSQVVSTQHPEHHRHPVGLPEPLLHQHHRQDLGGVDPHDVAGLWPAAAPT